MLVTVASWLMALSLSVLAMAQSQEIAQNSSNVYVQPSDNSQFIQLLLGTGSTYSSSLNYPLAALTPAATSLLQTNATPPIKGDLIRIGADNSNQAPPHGSIAYISCDSSDYIGNIDLNSVYNTAINNSVTAVVFFSRVSTQCSLTGGAPSGLQALYTTTSANNAKDVYQATTGNAIAQILNHNTFQQEVNSGQGSGSALGGPSTAVAMIILYSITGVITALFLAIIVTGAIRAHRHPERYGPRNIAGRTRQSRAKGIARAMLETIPIVKFGDNNNNDATKDVEMSEPSDASNRQGAADAANTSRGATSVDATDASKAADSNGAEDTQAAAVTVAPAVAQSGIDDDTVTCSICTEDFERGEDIRLLPCNHKFHPACVDPWLLDVSGTCPLCREDLRPAATSDPEAESGTMPPPLDPAAATNPTPTGGRLRGLLRRLQPTTAEERIAALRRFREENAQTSAAAAGTEAQTEEAHASRWDRVRRRVGL